MPGLVLAVACLPAGFALAAATGVRPLGGLLLLVLALFAARALEASPRSRVRWLLVVLGCFIASHLLALVVGPWPAVAVVALVAAAAYLSAARTSAAGRRLAPAARRPA